MKYPLYLIFLNFHVFIALHATGQYKFEIDGHIHNEVDSLSKSNIKNGDLVVLNFMNLARKDSVIVNNDAFKFSGELPYPSIAMLEYKYGGDLVLIDNSSYDFSLTLKKIDSTHRVYNGEIKTESRFFNLWKNFSAARGKLTRSRSNLTEAMQQDTSQDSLLYYKSEIHEVDIKIADHYKKFAVDNPDSYAAAYILPSSPDFSYARYIGIYSAFSDSIKNSFYGKNFYGRLIAAKNMQSGSTQVDINLDNDRFPIISSIDTSYKKIVLDESFFKKHRYTLIEFWASWCGPCRAVNENLKKMRKELERKGVILVGFSLDQNAEAWKIAVRNDKADWLQISDPNAINSPLARFLNLTVIPYNVMVDSNGKIIWKNIYGKQLHDFPEDIQ